MNKIKIVATIITQEEHQQFLLDAFKQLVKASRKEAGNMRYDLHQVHDNPQKFVFIETWQSQAAVDAHNASKHFADFLQAIEGKTEAVDIALLNDISANTP